MKAYGKTCAGKIRKNNEDSVLIEPTGLGLLPSLFVVSDGMGGHKAGEVASNRGIKFFCDYIDSLEEIPADYGISIKNAIQFANNSVYLLSEKNDKLEGMGATFTSCVVDANKVYCAHIGDSRLYQIMGNKIVQKTIDHSYVNEMLRAGLITEEEAETHPNRNLITRALGTTYDVEIDTYTFEVNQSDFLLLCSDGLTNMVKETDILRIILEDKSIEEKVDSLINSANENGGEDNISAILIGLEVSK